MRRNLGMLYGAVPVLLRNEHIFSTQNYVSLSILEMENISGSPWALTHIGRREIIMNCVKRLRYQISHAIMQWNNSIFFICKVVSLFFRNETIAFSICQRHKSTVDYEK